MMEQTLADLIAQGKVKVRFISIDLPVTATEGIPIGGDRAGGKCIGLRLQLPIYARNTVVAAQIAVAERVIYYGDAEAQEAELVAVPTKENMTPFLPCTDLNDIYIRGNGTRNLVQGIIYHLAE